MKDEIKFSVKSKHVCKIIVDDKILIICVCIYLINYVPLLLLLRKYVLKNGFGLKLCTLGMLIPINVLRASMKLTRQ